MTIEKNKFIGVYDELSKILTSWEEASEAGNQVAATFEMYCFLVDLQNSMASILNWYKRKKPG